MYIRQGGTFLEYTPTVVDHETMTVDIPLADAMKLTSGQVSKEDLQKLDEMLTLYKGIGGNGYADTIISQVRKLPIIL